ADLLGRVNRRVAVMDIESVPVWRLRLLFELSGIDDAGPAGAVWVRFQPDGVRFWIPGGPAGGPRAAPVARDVGNLGKVGVTTVADIRELSLGWDADDTARILAVALYLNNSARPTYRYATRSSLWKRVRADGPPTVRFSSTQLRRHPYWTVGD